MEMLRIGGRVITPVFPPAFQERAEMGCDVRGTAATLRKPNKLLATTTAEIRIQ